MKEEQIMDKYIDIIKEKLDDKRFQHSLGVAKTARELAVKYGVDPELAYLAGILHDYGKNVSVENLIKIAERNKLITDEVERTNPFLLHGPVGAYLIEKELGIKDREVLEAIRYHTTGKPNLDKLGLIIYITDLIEPNRKLVGLDTIRQFTAQDLYKGVLEGINYTLIYLVQGNQPIHGLSIETRNWLLELRAEN